jgi:hypothetical protein
MTAPAHSPAPAHREHPSPVETIGHKPGHKRQQAQRQKAREPDHAEIERAAGPADTSQPTATTMTSSAEPNSMSAPMKLAKAERGLSAAGAAGGAIQGCMGCSGIGVAESMRTLSRGLRLRQQIDHSGLLRSGSARIGSLALISSLSDH